MLGCGATIRSNEVSSSYVDPVNTTAEEIIPKRTELVLEIYGYEFSRQLVP